MSLQYRIMFHRVMTDDNINICTTCFDTRENVFRQHE